MPLKREYFPSDALKLINQSEGLVVRNRVRNTGAALGVDDSKTAHTIGRHLIKGSPGALGKGIPMAEARDRFLEAPDNVNSVWAGKGEMAVLLCELLNSDVGQQALAVMDNGVSRVVVHYLNLGRLAGLFGGLVGQSQLRESRIVVTPASEALVQVAVMNTKTNQPILVKGVPKMITKTIVTPKKAVGNIKACDIVTVNAVLDRFGNSLHLQTFYPSTEAVESYAEWRVGGISLVGYFSGGKFQTKMVPVG
jgi:hypothetical protein